MIQFREVEMSEQKESSVLERLLGMEWLELLLGCSLLAVIALMVLDHPTYQANKYYRCLDNENVSRTKAGLPPLSDEEVRNRCAGKSGYKPAT